MHLICHILDIINTCEEEEKEYGCCYSSMFLTVWIIGPDGGTLTFEGSDSFKLEIPPGAITHQQQLVYMYLHNQPAAFDGLENIGLSPVIDCGPDGLIFKVSCIP